MPSEIRGGIVGSSGRVVPIRIPRPRCPRRDAHVEMSSKGIRWEELDKTFRLPGYFSKLGDQTIPRKVGSEGSPLGPHSLGEANLQQPPQPFRANPSR